MIESFWSRFYFQVLLKYFLPFTLYWITTIIYVSQFAVHGLDEDKKWDFTTEMVLRMIVIILTVFFFGFEVSSMIRDGVC